MRKNYIKSIIVHTPDNFNYDCLTDIVNQFHIDVIERRLMKSNLTVEQKTKVIDNIILILKSKETNGVII